VGALERRKFPVLSLDSNKMTKIEVTLTLTVEKEMSYFIDKYCKMKRQAD
jgi:hypothetical protein